jgi:hypothetical protein
MQRRFEKITVADLRRYDVVLGADICFWDKLSPVLFNLIRRALRAGVQQVMIPAPQGWNGHPLRQ